MNECKGTSSTIFLLHPLKFHQSMTNWQGWLWIGVRQNSSICKSSFSCSRPLLPGGNRNMANYSHQTPQAVLVNLPQNKLNRISNDLSLHMGMPTCLYYTHRWCIYSSVLYFGLWFEFYHTYRSNSCNQLLLCSREFTTQQDNAFQMYTHEHYKYADTQPPAPRPWHWHWHNFSTNLRQMYGPCH